jgi:hypothetical protein
VSRIDVRSVPFVSIGNARHLRFEPRSRTLAYLVERAQVFRDDAFEAVNLGHSQQRRTVSKYA